MIIPDTHLKILGSESPSPSPISSLPVFLREQQATRGKFVLGVLPRGICFGEVSCGN